MSLAESERRRMLDLMGVPQFLLRADEAPSRALADAAVPAEAVLPPNRAITARPVAASSTRVERARVPAFVRQAVLGDGFQRDLLRCLGQSSALAPPQAVSAWPDFAVLIGADIEAPVSTIVVRIVERPRQARGKRALWRQLRSLLVSARPRS